MEFLYHCKIIWKNIDVHPQKEKEKQTNKQTKPKQNNDTVFVLMCLLKKVNFVIYLLNVQHNKLDIDNDLMLNIFIVCEQNYNS